MIHSIPKAAVSIALFALSAASAGAQEVKKDVEIRYQEAPELRDMTKLSVDPSISLPPQKATALPYSAAAVDVAIPSSISILEPAPFADTIYTSPYRGYAAFGFMPRFNLGASAGYKFLDTDRTRLNGWLQYDGTAYRGNLKQTGLPSHIIRRNTATIGLNLHQAVGKESFLDFGTDYTFARFNNLTPDRWVNQNINRFNISGLWYMAHGKMSYGLGAAFSRFAPTNAWGYSCLTGDPTSSEQPPIAHIAEPTRESRYDFVGFFNAGLTANSSLSINLQFSNQSFSHNASPFIGLSSVVSHLPAPDHSTLRIAPAYRLQKGTIDLNLGLNLDLTFNQGKAFHIAPNLQATWSPGDIVKVYLKARGGQHLNTLSSLYERAPYALPFGAWRNSQVALDAEVGVTVGSWKGLFAELSVGYARANDWLMAISTTDNANGGGPTVPVTSFTAIDMIGYRLHAAVGYNFRNIASLKASLDLAPQDIDRGYYLWADRAKMVADIDLTVHPIKNLDINLGWEIRSKRAQTNLALLASVPGTEPVYFSQLSSLGSVSNLKAGALYRITDQWSVFLTGENLLGRSYYLIGDIQGQGRTGLAGVTYKF